MLRAVVIAAGTILACGGAALIAFGVHSPGWQAMIIGIIVLVGTLFERWRYGRIEKPGNGAWQRTGERFIDPSTGKAVEVMFDPYTGERRYVDADPQNPES